MKHSSGIWFMNPVWKYAADNHILKLQRLQNKFIHTTSKSPRPTTACKLRVNLYTKNSKYINMYN
jgi:hypothetical protein